MKRLLFVLIASLCLIFAFSASALADATVVWDARGTGLESTGDNSAKAPADATGLSITCTVNAPENVDATAPEIGTAGTAESIDYTLQAVEDTGDNYINLSGDTSLLNGSKTNVTMTAAGITITTKYKLTTTTRTFTYSEDWTVEPVPTVSEVSETFTETFTIRAIETTTNIASFKVNGVALSGFSNTEGANAYSVSIPFSINSVPFEIITSGDHANITSSNMTLSKSSNTYSGNYTFSSSPATLTFLVTSESGATRSISVTLTRAAASTVNTIKSFSTQLISVTNSTKSFTVAASATTLTGTFPYATKNGTGNDGKVEVELTLDDANATAAISTPTGAASTSITNSSGKATFTLTNITGDTVTATITVTAESGADKHYQLTLTRAADYYTLTGVGFYTGSGYGSSTELTTSTWTTSSTSSSPMTVYVPSSQGVLYLLPIYGDNGSSANTFSISGTAVSGTPTASGNGYRVYLVSNAVSSNRTINITYGGNTYYYKLSPTEVVNSYCQLQTLAVSNSPTQSSGSRYIYTLSPALSANSATYSCNVDDGTTTVYLHLAADNDRSAIYSVSRSSGTGTVSAYTAGKVYQVTLTKGKSVTLSIVVRYNNQTSSSYNQTYTLTISAGSASGTLSSLLFSKTASNTGVYSMAPSFSSSIFNYVVLIPYQNGSATVYVKPTVSVSGDTVQVGSNSNAMSTVTSGDWQSLTSISAGSNQAYYIDIDGATNETYTVRAFHAPSNGSSNDTLSKLYIQTGSSNSSKVDMNTSFATSVSSYTAKVSESVSSVRVYAEAADNDAIVVVGGKYVDPASGYVSIALEEGENVIDVYCYAENCSDYTSYKLTITRGTSASQLKSMYLLSGNAYVSMSPTFSADLYNYVATVANGVSSLAFYATPNDSGSTMRLTVMQNSTTVASSKVISSGEANTYSLAEGVNSFAVTVTSSGGSSNTYYLSVYRQPSTLRTVVSSQALNIDGSARTLSAYNINGNNFVMLRDLAALLENSGCPISVSYNTSSNSVYITSNAVYTRRGDELGILGSAKRTVLSTQPIYLDYVRVAPIAYNIDGSNFVLLRDMAALLDFGVSYSGSTIYIDSDTNYVPGK
ncbi:MAG: cadherin-like beta sandwich domain-containing protein [Bacillota bacterium]|nr:cadherin-like beta sandwich domain-containing protein [Bacillota bacterium]